MQSAQLPAFASRRPCLTASPLHWSAIFLALLFLLTTCTAARNARAQVPWSVPSEIASTHFTVTLNGRPTPVMHAAVNLYFLNFPATRRLKVTVTADSDGFWDRGVDIQPWRLAIRPTREGRTLSFTLDGPAKITLSRPNDFLGNADMLFLFANPPEVSTAVAGKPGVRYFGPGVHRENIDAASGDRIYLAPGAVVFGSLNLWQVQDVQVSGRGTLVYDGPQNPADDDGWMHKPNWHCIVMDQARDISIEGITCVVRSRTWQIQMKDSHGIRFQNFKTIAANDGNANGDGLDWLGGGDTTIDDSFFRAADDVFALQSSWEGYGPAAFAIQGTPVRNIHITNSVLSTSISNIVRAGWPEKNFEGGDFSMENSDVLHAGLGGCGIPFALMEFWADPNGRGVSDGFAFRNIRLEDWYSLTQLMEPVDGVHNVHFTDISALETPAMVPSELRGVVQGTAFDNVRLAGPPATSDANVPIAVANGTEAPTYAATGPQAMIHYNPGLLRPGHKLHFEAAGPTAQDERYDWSFGDGTHVSGRVVTHIFPDTAGTLLDGTGRFRVLLHVTDPTGRETWTAEPVVLADTLQPALASAGLTAPGLLFRAITSDHPTLAALMPGTATATSGTAAQLTPALRPRDQNYALGFDGFLDIPEDGGYTFTLISNDAGDLRIDGRTLAVTPEPFAQVCGFAGNAARPARGSIALARGLHQIEVRETHTTGLDNFRLLWQGPNLEASQVPATRLSHTELNP